MVWLTPPRDRRPFICAEFSNQNKLVAIALSFLDLRPDAIEWCFWTFEQRRPTWELSEEHLYPEIWAVFFHKKSRPEERELEIRLPDNKVEWLFSR